MTTIQTITSEDIAFLMALVVGPAVCLIGAVVMMLKDAMKPAKRERRVMRWMDRV